MLPTIFPGDTLEIRPQRFEQVNTGDIVLASSHGNPCAHRVVREEFRYGRRVLFTRGDALPFEDAQPVKEADFLGVVAFILRRGRRFRPALSSSPSHTVLRALLRRSAIFTDLVLRLHSLWRRTVPQAPQHVDRPFELLRGFLG